MKKEEPRQETLEEAAAEFAKNHSIYPTAQDDTEYGFINGAKWQQEQDKNLYNLLDENYDLNIQFHQAIRESIFSFAVAVYDEKLTFEEWTKKHYGKHIEVSKNLYSEEEVIKILIECCGEVSCEDGALVGKSPAELVEWIDTKFKKK